MLVKIQVWLKDREIADATDISDKRVFHILQEELCMKKLFRKLEHSLKNKKKNWHDSTLIIFIVDETSFIHDP